MHRIHYISYLIGQSFQEKRRGFLSAIFSKFFPLVDKIFSLGMSFGNCLVNGSGLFQKGQHVYESIVKRGNIVSVLFITRNLSRLSAKLREIKNRSSLRVIMSQATPTRSITHGIIRMSAPKPKDYTGLYYIIAASARNNLSSALSKNRS